MKRVFTKNCKSLFRALLLVSVLPALLFSRGEGVQLFPFPILEIAKNAPRSIKGNYKIPYQFNIHRFENSQGNFQTKFQRDNPQNQWAKSGSLQNKPKPVFSANLPQIYFSANFESFNSRLFLSSQGSRAPPVS